MNNRMDSMDSHMHLMESRINKRLDVLERDSKDTNKKMDIMLNELMRNSEQHTQSGMEIEELKDDIKEVKIDVNKLKNKTEQLDEKIEQKTDIVVGILNQLLDRSADNTARIKFIENTLGCNDCVSL